MRLKSHWLPLMLTLYLVDPAKFYAILEAPPSVTDDVLDRGKFVVGVPGGNSLGALLDADGVPIWRWDIHGPRRLSQQEKQAVGSAALVREVEALAVKGDLSGVAEKTGRLRRLILGPESVAPTVKASDPVAGVIDQ